MNTRTVNEAPKTTLDLREGMRVKRFPNAEFNAVSTVHPGQTRRSAVVTFTDGTKVTVGRQAEWIVDNA